MAEQQLNGPDIGARFQQMNRKSVSKQVRSNWLADTGEPAGNLLAGQFHRRCADGAVGEVAWERASAGSLLTRHQVRRISSSVGDSIT